MYKVTELARRDIINISDGSKLGMVTDLQFDENSGTIRALVVSPSRKMGMFRAGRDLVIPWERIVTLGVHAVLVRLDQMSK